MQNGATVWDAILSVQVIHHSLLAQIHVLAGETTRVLKPHGLIFVTVPQLLNQGTPFQQVEPETDVPLGDREAGLPHHYFTPTELRDLFQPCRLTDLYEGAGGLLLDAETLPKEGFRNENQNSNIGVYSGHAVDCRNNHVRRIPAWNFRPAN